MRIFQELLEVEPLPWATEFVLLYGSYLPLFFIVIASLIFFLMLKKQLIVHISFVTLNIINIFYIIVFKLACMPPLIKIVDRLN